jgi:amino acid permease
MNQPAPKSPLQPRELFVFEQPAMRLELLVRILYWILIGIVNWIYGLLAGICMIIQWFVILILGHRNRDLSDFIRGYLEYHIHVLSYITVMTDRRPDVMPVKVRICEEFPVGKKT